MPAGVSLLIDTAVVPARERLDFWLDSSCDAYHPLQIRSPTSDDFWARMWIYELEPLSFFRIAAAENTMLRTSRAIAAGDPECLHVSMIEHGQLNAAQEGRTGIARAGDVVSYETSHPAIFWADQPFQCLVLRVPRSLLGKDAEQISSLTATPVSASDGVPKAAVTFFRGLAARLENGSVSPAKAPHAVQGAVDLVRSLYARSSRAQRARSRAELLLSVESFIEANLGDPSLDPEEVARASFISTRYLHKLFEAEGTSVCQWIRISRLERCRRDLLDPGLDHLTILAIASRWGLPGPQHFCRLFRTAYGCSPSEFRRDGRDQATDAMSVSGWTKND
jgi:AraC-like DNA-binding protein